MRAYPGCIYGPASIARRSRQRERVAILPHIFSGVFHKVLSHVLQLAKAIEQSKARYETLGSFLPLYIG